MKKYNKIPPLYVDVSSDEDYWMMYTCLQHQLVSLEEFNWWASNLAW